MPCVSPRKVVVGVLISRSSVPCVTRGGGFPAVSSPLSFSGLCGTALIFRPAGSLNQPCSRPSHWSTVFTRGEARRWHMGQHAHLFYAF